MCVEKCRVRAINLGAHAQETQYNLHRTVHAFIRIPDALLLFVHRIVCLRMGDVQE